MTKVLLSLHVLAAILTVGPVAVAASMFPPAVRLGRHDQLRLLHRICRGYAAVGIAVPVFGLATASALGVLGDAWLITSIALTALAAAVLVFQLLPAQQKLLAGAGTQADDTLTNAAAPAGAPATGTQTAGSQTTGSQAIGTQTAGAHATGSQTAGAHAVGTATTSTNTTGSQAAGTQTAGTQTAGSQSTGSQVTGAQTVGAQTVGAQTVSPPASTIANRVAMRLAMSTGIFNLLWATVTVLMIVRPGSTTGV